MMSNYITHFSSPKQNNDFIVYHQRAKSIFTESQIPRTNSKKLFSDITKESETCYSSRNPTPEKIMKEAISPKCPQIFSPKFSAQKEFLENFEKQKSESEIDRKTVNAVIGNTELKKQIKLLETKVSTYLKENENLQKRIHEFKAQQKMFDHANRETDAIKKELEAARRKIKKLDQENAQMQSEKVNLVKSSGNEEIDIRLSKHTKYIVSYLNKSDINNSVRFFFEERFISEKNIASLLKTKEYGIIALQAFRYIGDLLGHLNIPQPNQEQCFYPERREYIQYISEPSSICLSPLRNESRDITPRDLVTEMMEGKTTEEEEYERINYLQQITSKTSKSANLKKGRQQDIASKVKSPQNSNKKALTSRIAKTAATTPQGHSPVKRLISKNTKHQQSPDNLQSVEKNKYIQQSKFPPRLEIKQISYKELIGQHNQPLSSHRRFAENTERSQLDSERAILSLESARRRNTQKIKEADPHFKDPKGNVAKLNFGILGRRDAYKTENKFSNDETRILDPLKERIIEQNEKQLLTIGGSILKNSAYHQENISIKFRPLECADDEINTLRQRILEAQRRANSKSQEFLGLQIATNNQGLLKHDQPQDKNESQNPKSPNIEDTINMKEKAFEASPQRMEKEKIKIVERTPNRCKSRQDERSGNEKRTERFVTFDGTDLQDFTYSDKEFHLIGRTPRKSPNGQQELKLQKDFEQINDKKINRNISSSRKIELANTQICDILKETAIKPTK